MNTFHIKTWGCEMNYSDTEKIRSLLESHGLKYAGELEEVDLIILNTCSVRQRAEDKVFGLGRKLMKLKELRPEVQVVLTGCMAQRLVRKECEEEVDSKYARDLRGRMKWVDHIVEIENLDEIGRIAGREGDELEGSSISEDGSEYSNTDQAHRSDITASVPISKGCDNFCTYCVVPYTRGSEVSIPFGEIYDQVEGLINRGYKLITLLGQNVNSWRGKIDGKPISFPELLSKLCEIEGEFWLTFLTSHPKDFSEELVEVIGKNEKICRFVNLPIQSGSDKILKEMNRKYTLEDYLGKVQLLRSKVPDIRLSTDIIVGFPGESEEDFGLTMKLIREVKFEMIYHAEYSPRYPAASSRIEDSVPAKTKKKRRKELDEAEAKIIEEKNKEAVGSHMVVLVTSDKFGKTHDLRDVQFQSSFQSAVEEHIGSLVKAEIIASSVSGLVGQVAV